MVAWFLLIALVGISLQAEHSIELSQIQEVTQAADEVGESSLGQHHSSQLKANLPNPRPSDSNVIVEIEALKYPIDLNNTDGPIQESSQIEECPLCLEECTGPYKMLPCKHLIHTPCLEKWVATSLTCPYCRVPCPDEQPAPHTLVSGVPERNTPGLVQELTERARFQIQEHFIPDIEMQGLCRILFFLLAGLGGGVTGYFLASVLLSVILKYKN
ncbi:hypothetical protein PGT21_015851 [Puccinia graminis f. sp. tritici]|uniref:RING-type domain-containing protein n=1 Tax=Puccinia graminis f. sp. tritici TaxID=56615 RepID=A0A5B0NJB1_PUCGR|nr:hypothetical protein PGT21_015851 [Puccinia graminis f. sp. tritici]